MDSREEIKNRVRESADIVQVIGECVELKKAGSRFTGLCPFHAEKTPSFSVNPQGQFFHCFGCGESGDVFSFMMKYHHLTFPDALKDLARRYHVDLPERKMSDADRARMKQREQLYLVNHTAATIYRDCLHNSADAAAARSYLAERGVPEEIIQQYRLGYTPPPETAGWKFITSRLQAKKLSVLAIEQAGLAVKKDNGGYYDRFRDRVLFPIYDMSGREVAFGGRILGEGKPKYMNSPQSAIFDKSRLLFGLYPHREAIRNQRRAVVVEGNFDMLSLAIHGIDYVVAPLGTSLTRPHVRSLRGLCEQIILLFDGDAAGLKAAMRSVPHFLAEQVEARVALLPEGEDPDTLVRGQGAEAVLGLLEGAAPLPEFLFEALVKKHGLTLDGKNRIIAELQPLLAAGSGEQRDLMAAHFGQKLGVSPARITRARPVRSPQPPFPGEDVEPPGLRNLPRRLRQIVDFLILYPEFFPKLWSAGLDGLKSYAPLAGFLAILHELAAKERLTPENIFSALPEGAERRYVARLFMEAARTPPEEEGGPETMCEELVRWLDEEKLQSREAKLLERIREAQAKGDSELLMALLREKQECGRKRRCFCDNLLKNE
jgi:DNA primase